MTHSSPPQELLSRLPISLTSFIGREKEIARVKELLAATRLLTLTGAGGSGKTRLALQVAREAERKGVYADGVHWVELAPLVDPAQVPRALAQTLGAAERAGVTVMDTILLVLQDRSLLVVLDNCEHLIEASARLADQILKTCAGVHILATSRESLNIEGERVWNVPSLSVPPHSTFDLHESDAVELFLERASAIQSDLHLDQSNAEVIAQICRHLDGIPLAIELAAARVRVLSVEQILERLDHSLCLLTDGKRTAVERHQTLRATLDWSHNLLPASEQILFRRLSVFAGGFDLAAAEAVSTADADDVLNGLTRLVDKSLVARQEDAHAARYRLLEPIRQYAREKLVDATESEMTSQRHFDFFLQLAQEAQPHLNGSQQMIWLKRLDAEHDNFRVAAAWARTSGAVQQGLRLAVALRWFWEWQGYWGEASENLSHSLEPVPSDNEEPALPALLERANLALGSFIQNLGDRQGAERRFGAVIAFAQSRDDQATIAEALLLKGIAACDRGDYTAGRADIAESYARCRGLGDPHLEAWALKERGYYSLLVGEINAARADLEESLRLYRSIGHPLGTAWSLSMLGLVRFHQGDYAAARILNEESIEMARHVGGKIQLAIALQRLAQVLVVEGDFAQAALLLEENLAIRRETGERATIGHMLVHKSTLARLTGDLSSAHTLAETGLRMAKEADYRLGEAHALAAIGKLALAQGDYAKAQTCFEEARVLREQMNNNLDMPTTLQDMGDLAFCEGNFALAKDYYDQTLAVSHQIASEQSVPTVLRMLGYIALYEGDLKAAAQRFTEGFNLTQQRNFRRGMICHLFAFASVMLALGDARRAARLLAAADALLEGVGVRLETAEAMACERTRSAVRDQLPTAILDRASAQGRTLTLEQGIADAQRSIQRGQTWIDPQRGGRARSSMGRLTPRQREIAALISEGKSNREIATELVISERTVENHVGTILSILQFHSRTQIATWAVANLQGKK